MPVEWFERYGARFEQYRLPTDKHEREELAKMIGADGYWLLDLIYDRRAPGHLRELDAVQILRTVWLQQFYVENNTVQWRDKRNLPPSERQIITPFDPEARYSHKRDITWTGYKAHLTETCDEFSDALHKRLIMRIDLLVETGHVVQAKRRFRDASVRRVELLKQLFEDTRALT